MRAPARHGVYLWLSVAVLAAVVWVFASWHGTPIVDDAYIALIYARNLADGQGLVYTDGGRVEGYTDFLWVLAGALAFKLGLEPVRFLQSLSLVSAIGLVFVTWRWSSRESIASDTFRIAPLVLAASGPLAFWALAGLETVTFSLLLLVATMWTARSAGPAATFAAGTTYAAAAMTHPDGALWLFVGVVFLLVKSGRPAVNKSLVAFIGGFGPFMVFWVWRWIYFGDPLPNTFYAKSAVSLVTLEQGAKYVLDFATVWGVLNVAIIVAAVFGGLLTRPITRLLFANCIVWLAYLVWIGGDSLLVYRFVLPILAPLTLLLQESLAILMTRAGMQRLPVVAGFAFAGILTVGSAVSWRLATAGSVAMAGAFDASRVAVGQWLRHHTAPGTLIAVNAAGAIPYFSERPAIDMLGLNDRHIGRNGHVAEGPAGHRRHDAAYVLSRRPTFVILNAAFEQGQRLNPAGHGLPSVTALLAMPGFRDEYARIRLTKIGRHEILYIRKDALAEFDSRGLIQVVPDPP